MHYSSVGEGIWWDDFVVIKAGACPLDLDVGVAVAIEVLNTEVVLALVELDIADLCLLSVVETVVVDDHLPIDVEQCAIVTLRGELPLASLRDLDVTLENDCDLVDVVTIPKLTHTVVLIEVGHGLEVDWFQVLQSSTLEHDVAEVGGIGVEEDSVETWFRGPALWEIVGCPS